MQDRWPVRLSLVVEELGVSALAARGSVTVSHQDANGTWLIALRGEHDLATRPSLEQETRGVWPLCTIAVVDLSEVAFIDSGVIAWLLKTRREFEVSGVTSLRIVEGPPGSVAARGLTVFGVRELLTCYPTLDEALAQAPVNGRSSGGFQRYPSSDLTNQVVLAPRWREGADAAELAGGLFDRIGKQAWALAVWILKDEQLAEEFVVAEFARATWGPKLAPRGDAGVLCDVRCRAIVAVGARPAALAGGRHLDVSLPRSRADSLATTVRDAITALPEPQRAVIELVLFGRLTVGAIASATTTSRADVLADLADAVLTLRPIAGVIRSSATASECP